MKLPFTFSIHKGENRMKPLRVYVCEDEDMYLGVNRSVLEKLLEEKNIKADITYAHNYKEQDDQFLATVELAILDIDLEGSILNGIQLAERMLKMNPCTVFIFITSHREFAYEATKIHLSGFLDKPLDPFVFKDAFGRAITQVNGYRMKNANNNMATFQNEKILLQEKNIISIQKVPKTHEIDILTTEKTIRTIDSIKDTEKRLSSNFVKVNCSVIVNLSYIFNIDGNMVMMRGGASHSISARNRNKVRKAYEEYISRRFV